MHSYGQFCPIARASEILGERWSMIIVRNLSVGCTTFTEIAEGAPGLSRPLLSKRLRELQRAGLIEIRPKPDGHGSLYVPTQAGRELWEVMLALGDWALRWVELTPEHAHPGVVLWSWVKGLPMPGGAATAACAGALRVPHHAGWRAARVVTGGARPRRDLREGPAVRGGSGGHGQRSPSVRPMAPRPDRMGRRASWWRHPSHR